MLVLGDVYIEGAQLRRGCGRIIHYIKFQVCASPVYVCLFNYSVLFVLYFIICAC